jgi:hypothetical protein
MSTHRAYPVKGPAFLLVVRRILAGAPSIMPGLFALAT